MPLNSSAYFPFALLGIGIASFWMPGSSGAWRALATAAVCAAFLTGVINGAGLLATALAAAAIYRSRQGVRDGPLRVAVRIGAGVIILGLFAHLLPGFRETVLASNAVLSPGAYPTSIIWIFDKPFAALLLAGSGLTFAGTRRDWAALLPAALAVSAACITFMAAGALALHAVAWAPKWTPLSALFAVGNLFFVCIPEELLFRAVLQQKLTNVFLAREWSAYGAIAATSLLFGLCHVAGGPGLMAVSTVAGFFYGLAYYRTGRVEASVVVHFLLNLTHFTLFSYPALKP